MEETAMAGKIEKLPTGEIRFFPIDEDNGKVLAPIDFISDVFAPYFGKDIILFFKKENEKVTSIEIDELK